MVMEIKSKMLYLPPVTEVFGHVAENVICASEQVSSSRQNYTTTIW